MFTTRKAAYAAIATGCLSVGVAAIGFMNGLSETTTTMNIQTSPASMAVIETDSVVVSKPADVTPGAERPEVAAGFRAYQDADGNFVAPPPEVAAASAPSIQRPSGAVAERQSTVPGGGFVVDTSGFRMSQTAHVTPNGEVVVACDQDIEDPAVHASHTEER